MKPAWDLLPHSLRTFARHKRFSALAILALALAIALNTTMYSVLDALINPKVAMREPERLFRLGYYGDFKGRIPESEKRDAVYGLKSFEGIAGSWSGYGETNIAERGPRSYDVRVLNVTPNYFEVLGNRPLAGRLLSVADANVEPRPIVISERLWKQLFPEREWFEPATIRFGEEARTVVGILSYGADFPGAYTDLWQLAPADNFFALRGSYSLVRLRESVTLERAWVELQVLAHRFAFQAGELPKNSEFRLSAGVGEPFRFQRFHIALIAAVAAVLLVACVNLANLQLARGIARSRELATRSALGASRRDIIAQLVLESMWLALAGLLLGLLLTVWGMRLVGASVPPSLADFLIKPQMSWRVLAFAAAAAFVCLGFIGLLPAIKLSRVDIHSLIKAGAGTGTSRMARRQYGVLVVVQISLALALLVGATLLLRTAAGLYRLNIPPHFDRLLFGNVAIRSLRLQPDGLATASSRDTRRAWPVAEGVLSRVRAMPGVENAAISLWRQPKGLTISLADPGGQAREIPTGRYSYDLVSSEFLRVTGLVLHKGRDFASGEFAEPLVIVDDQTARFLWPGQDAIGKRIKFGRDSSRAAWLEVIGVVRHFNFWTPFSRPNQEERTAPRLGAIFVLGGSDTAAVGWWKNARLVVRARGVDDVRKLPNRLRAAIRLPAEGVRVSYVQSWRQETRIDMLRERQDFVTALFATFAALALALAALGVYAIVSHSVSQRTREFGVRIALGASASDIRRSVLQEGNVLALTGIAVGLILAAQTVGLLEGFLRSEDDRFDSPLFAVVALVLFGVAWLASYIPARRAMRIDPREALKNE